MRARSGPSMRMLMIERRNWRLFAIARVALAGAVVCGALAAADAGAQTVSTSNSAVQQVQIFNQRTETNRQAEERLATPPDPVTGEEAAADADIGEQWLFKPNPPVQPWSAHADLSAFYTTNAALASSGAQSDRFLVADVGVGYSRPFAGDFAVTANLQQGFFRYDEFTALDFDSLGANLGLSYQARQLADVVFSLQYGFSRLTRATFEEELFLGNSVGLVATKLIKLSTADTIEFSGGGGYTFADPGELQRLEFRATIGYAIRITRALTATAMVRNEFFDYQHGRQDFLQSIALAARYDFTKWISASVAASVANNSSDRNVFDYGVFNGGLTASAHVQF
jgi:hypothetical protein